MVFCSGDGDDDRNEKDGSGEGYDATTTAMKRMALATTHGSKRKVSKSASIMILRLSDSLCILCTPQVHGIVLGDDDNEKDGSDKGDDGGNERMALARATMAEMKRTALAMERVMTRERMAWEMMMAW